MWYNSDCDISLVGVDELRTGGKRDAMLYLTLPYSETQLQQRCRIHVHDLHDGLELYRFSCPIVVLPIFLRNSPRGIFQCRLPLIQWAPPLTYCITELVLTAPR